jgi:hypothetical protein
LPFHVFTSTAPFFFHQKNCLQLAGKNTLRLRSLTHQIQQNRHTSQISEKSKEQRFKPRQKAKSYKKSKYDLPPGIQKRKLANGNFKYYAGIRTSSRGYIHVGSFDELEVAVESHRAKYFELYKEFPDYEA